MEKDLWILNEDLWDALGARQGALNGTEIARDSGLLALVSFHWTRLFSLYEGSVLPCDHIGPRPQGGWDLITV